MTTTTQRSMSWEDETNELSEVQVKEQLARMLATGALEAARRQPATDRENRRAGGPEERLP